MYLKDTAQQHYGSLIWTSIKKYSYYDEWLLWAIIKITPPGGLEPPTFRLTAERASRLRHGGVDI